MKRAALVLLVLLAVAVIGWRISRSRSFQFFGGLVTRVDTAEPVVALTFDDGPTALGVDFILPLLDSLDVRATFFLTGREIAESPELAPRLIAAGHAIGNHSYTHSQMVLKSLSFVRDEIEQTDALIRQAGWTGDIPFRPPYGKRLLVLPYYLDATGRKTLLWDVEPESNQGPEPDPVAMATDAIEYARPGSIIIMHIMYESRRTSREAIPLIVDGLRDRGFRFVTVQELMQAYAND
ncbi:MAG: polysaccharide deacetylase family protein [Rhodothermales bacterium]